jgi:predicted O-methyltransferase YrrM
VVTWTSDDTFELGETEYVCRPVGPHFRSEPGRFCLLKAPEHVEWYERLLREQTPRHIVEVGSYEGASSAFFAEIARPKKLVTIDRRATASPAFSDFITRRGFDDVIAPYFGVDQGNARRLREIADEEFGDAALDLVIDDASHLVDKTRTTFNCLFPRLAPGGTYVIEDWAWAHSVFAEKGDWANERPLTALIFELILACGSHPMLVSNVNVFWDYAIAERGPAEIDAKSFDLSSCYGPRGAALIAD